MKPAALPLFPDPLPAARRGIPGWKRGDRAEYPDPKAKLLNSRGTVIAVLAERGDLCIRPDHRAEVQIIILASRCRRIR